MEWLVTPDRTVHAIESRKALDAFMKQRGIDWKTAGNLRQLLRFNKVGNDRCDANDRSDRHEAGGKGNKYYRFEDVSWFYHPGVSTAVPLFGSSRGSKTAQKSSKNHDSGDIYDVDKTMTAERYFNMMTTTFQQWRLSGQQPHSSASSLSQRGGSSSDPAPASRTAGQKRTYVEVLSSEEVGSEEELGSDVVAAEDFGAARLRPGTCKFFMIPLSSVVGWPVRFCIFRHAA